MARLLETVPESQAESRVHHRPYNNTSSAVATMITNPECLLQSRPRKRVAMAKINQPWQAKPIPHNNKRLMPSGLN